MEKVALKNNLEKTDILVIAISGVITALLSGAISYVFLDLTKTLIIAGALGLLGGIGVNYVRKTLLTDVTYPTVSNLTKLTLYTLTICTIIALMIVGLDLFFVQMRGYIL